MKTSTVSSDFARTTIFTSNTDGKRPMTVYSTVHPDKIIVPIFSAIFSLPILAFILICLLRKRAKMARERDRQLNYGLHSHAVSLVRYSRNASDGSKVVSFRSGSFNRSLELSVVEERSDIEQTDLMTETPVDNATQFDFFG